MSASADGGGGGGGGLEQITTTRQQNSLVFVTDYCSVVYTQYIVKKLSRFPVPSRHVTNQTLPGRVPINPLTH
jgi:hypothetical protein